MQDASQERAETRADLGDGTFASAGAAGAERDGAGDDFYEGDARADDAGAIVVGVDGGIGAMAFGFGGQGVDDDAADEAAEGGDDEQEPGDERASYLAKRATSPPGPSCSYPANFARV